MFYSVLLSTFFFFNCASGDRQEEITTKATKPYSFKDQVIVSDDQGETWNSLDVYLPKDLKILSLSSDQNNLFVGTEKAEIYKINMLSSANAEQENLMTALINQKPIDENRVYGMFSCASGLYSHVYGIGLLRKQNNAGYWQPLTTPEGVHGISKIVEDSKGNLFMATQFGVYRSDDKGKSWDRKFQYGFANNILIHNNALMVTGINGIHQSDDEGKSWSPIKSLQNQIGLHNNNDNSVQMFKEGNTLYVLKRMSSAPSFMSTEPGNMLVYSNDNGKTWVNHPAESVLKNKQGIQSVFIHKNKLYYTTNNSLMRSDDNGLTWKNILHIADKKPNLSFRYISAGDRLILAKSDFGC